MEDLSGAGIHLASAYVSVIADLRPLEAGLASAEAQTKSFARTTTASTATASAALIKQGAAAEAMGAKYVATGKRIGGFGKTLNRTVTLPLVGIGVAAGAMALKFNRSMLEISTQAGASRGEVKKLSKEVLSLSASGRFAQGPNQLAEALFDIESVGYRGAKAMKTLGAASDFAAVGNADLESTTSALVGALKTGIKGAGDARQAIGTLNATIGAGKMHMEDLNGAIGTGFLGSAKGLGLSLQSVGSALAELTSQGVPANSAATRLRMSFSLLANPTEKAQKILAGIGLGSEDMAKKMRGPNGLGHALEDLQAHLKGLTQVEQQQLLAGAFGGAKSGGTIVQLLGNLDDLNVKYHEIGKNAGNFQQKLDETNADPAVKLDKAWSALQADLIQVGDVLGATVVPMLLAGGKALGGVVEGFDSLPEPTKKVIAGLLLLTAAAGPTLRVIGFMTKGWGLLLLGVDKLEAGLVGGAAASTEATAANTALSASYVELSASIRGAAAAQGAFSATESGLLVPGAAGAMVPGRAAGGRFSSAMNKAGRGLAIGAGGAIAGSMVGGPAGNLISKVGMGAGIGSIGGLPGAAIGAGVGAVIADVEALSGAEKKLHPIQERLAASSASVKKWFDAQRKASAELSNAETGVTHSKQREKNAADNVRQAQQHLNNVIGRYGAESKPAVRAEFELAQAQGKHARAAHAVEAAERKHGFALEAYKAATRVTLGTEKQRIAALKTQAANLENLFHKEQKAEASAKRLGELGHRGSKTLSELSGAQKNYAQTLGDASAKAGGKWAHHMANMSSAELKFANHLDSAMVKMDRLGNNEGAKKLGKTFRGVLTETQGLTDHIQHIANATGDFERKTSHLPTGAGGAWHKVGAAAGGATTHIATGVQKASTAQNHYKANTESNLGAVGKGYHGLDEKATKALGDISAKASATIQHFGGAATASPTGGGGHTATGVGHHAQGGKVTKPIAVMGEEAPRHHEWVVATNPAYRNQNLGYWAQAGKDLGVPGFAEGGKHGALTGGAGSLPHPHLHGPQPVAAAAQAGVDAAYKAAQKYIERQQAKGGPGGASFGPAGVGSYKGLPMANWVIQALMFAASKGVSPQPTSGYRPGYDPHTVTGVSEHSGTQYPHGAVDFGGMYGDPAAKAAKMSVVRATAGFQYPLLAPIGFVDDGHASGTGHKKGGLRGVPANRQPGYAGINFLSSAGSAPPSTGELVGASYYGGPSDSTSGTVGSSGVSLPGKMAVAELAMGKALGGLDYHTKLKIGYNGKSVVAEKLDIGAGGGAVGGHNRAIDLWYETANAIGMPGTAVVKVSPADGSSTATKKETVPAIFHGARTKSLSFGAIPKTLHGVNREIQKRQNELHRYRTAAAKATGKAMLERAIKANITALENRLKQLFRAKAQLRRKLAEKKYKRKLGKQLGQVTGFEKVIQGQQRDYEIANQYAEQVVGTEPLPPELPGTASEADRVKSEKEYVKTLESYVATKEEPAYMDVLGKEAVWRNTILTAEDKAQHMELGWEENIRKLEKEIESINGLGASHTEKWWHSHPKALKHLKEERARLPMLRFKERELRGTLGEGRGEFYRGVKDPAHPPVVPLEGTGSLEEALIGVQGVHWPDQHSKTKGLPAKRVAGVFGGAIWDTQSVMEELSLKAVQAANAIGSPSGGPEEDTALAEAKKQVALEGNQRKLIEDAQRPILDAFKSLPPYGGSFAAGGEVPGPAGAARLVVAHGGETITPEGGSNSQIVIVIEDGAVDPNKIKVIADAAVDVRLRRGGRSAGRALPGGPGGVFTPR